MMHRSVVRRFAALLEVALLSFAGYTWIAQPAYAAAATLVPAQATNLTALQSNITTLTTTAATPAGVFLAVSQCGNATSAGVPLATAAENDCTGAGDLTIVDSTLGGLHLIGFAGGNVAAGAHPVNMLMRKTGIGSNNAQCIAGGTIPCQLVASTATVAGASVGHAYDFSIATNITYAGAVTTTVATTTGATTTKPPTTTVATTTGATTTGATTTGATTTKPPTTTVATTTGATTTGATTTVATTTKPPTTTVATTTGATTTVATTTAGATTTGATTSTTTVGTTTTAPPSTPTLVAVPSSGLSNGQTIKARLTGLSATAPAAQVFVAVTQCGNATKAGVPLTVTAEADCVGAEGLGDGTLNLSDFVWPGPAKDVPLVLKRIGIGTNGAQCIANGTIPCTVVASTASFTGAYTGAGSFTLEASITYAAGGGTTTTSPVKVAGATATNTSGTLPNTGGSPWPMIFLGLAILNAGWLLISMNTPYRRWKRSQGHGSL